MNKVIAESIDSLANGDRPAMFQARPFVLRPMAKAINKNNGKIVLGSGIEVR